MATTKNVSFRAGYSRMDLTIPRRHARHLLSVLGFYPDGILSEPEGELDAGELYIAIAQLRHKIMLGEDSGLALAPTKNDSGLTREQFVELLDRFSRVVQRAVDIWTDVLYVA